MQRARSCPHTLSARSLDAVTASLLKPTHRLYNHTPSYFIIRLERVRQDLGRSLNSSIYGRLDCNALFRPMNNTIRTNYFDGK